MTEPPEPVSLSTASALKMLLPDSVVYSVQQQWVVSDSGFTQKCFWNFHPTLTVCALCRLDPPPGRRWLPACFGIRVSHRWRPSQILWLFPPPGKEMWMSVRMTASEGIGVVSLVSLADGATLLSPSVMLTRTSIESFFWKGRNINIEIAV